MAPGGEQDLLADHEALILAHYLRPDNQRQSDDKMKRRDMTFFTHLLLSFENPPTTIDWSWRPCAVTFAAMCSHSQSMKGTCRSCGEDGVSAAAVCRRYAGLALPEGQGRTEEGERKGNLTTKQ